MYGGANAGFRKLLGREKHFIKLQHNLNVEALRRAVEAIPAAKWLESERERLFDVHRDTQALQMVHFEDHIYEKPDYRELYFQLKDDVQPFVDYVASYYRNNGFIVRWLLAKLQVGGKIPKHTDAGASLLNCHRVHVPIITNKDVVFHVGGEEINMRAGEMWEINNGTVHGVENRGDQDRVHLIIDWMPNYAGESEQTVLKSGETEGAPAVAATAATLDAMVAQAHQLQRDGHHDQAESPYRQVLHIDDHHALANNLLGLLCLQLKRFDEAVKRIQKTLASMPDDAQAHANLGLAFAQLQQLDDASKQFHASLKLKPSNARVYNNLGNIYLAQGKVKDALRCYQQALAIQPSFGEVHYNMGSAYLRLQRYQDAVASLEQCLVLQLDFAPDKADLEQARQQLQARTGPS